jgi:hypothetical protein
MGLRSKSENLLINDKTEENNELNNGDMIILVEED